MADEERDDMTINVGLGTGSKEQKLQGVQLLIGAQKEALAAGMVSKKKLYNSCFIKASCHHKRVEMII